MESREHRERDERLVQISELVREYRDTINGLTADNVRSLCDIAYSLEKAEQVFITGNGGSAATAIHFASDLRAVSIKAVSLCENVAVLTRLANDESYGKVFIRQLQELNFGVGLTQRDVLVLISASGDSTNIIEAASYARMIGAVVIGLIGFGGGKLKELCDFDITLESRDYGVVEGLHSCFCHIIPQVVKEIREANEKTATA